MKKIEINCHCGMLTWEPPAEFFDGVPELVRDAILECARAALHATTSAALAAAADPFTAVVVSAQMMDFSEEIDRLITESMSLPPATRQKDLVLQ